MEDATNKPQDRERNQLYHMNPSKVQPEANLHTQYKENQLGSGGTYAHCEYIGRVILPARELAAPQLITWYDVVLSHMATTKSRSVAYFEGACPKETKS
jgi:hypothetical protein